MSNRAAVITGDVGDPNNLTQVKEVPYPTASDDQLIIKTVAYAVNPTDWKTIYKQSSPVGSIAGADASGVVEYVGKNVTQFKKGDVVSTFVQGSVGTKYGAFQEYMLADQTTTIKYPKKFSDEPLKEGDHDSDTINTFEAASSITLGISTVGLSFASNLKISPDRSANKDKTILIWGGATATGILAIQVAKHIYGLKVVTTASASNHSLLKNIGADVLINYKDEEDLQNLTKFDYSYVLDTVSSDLTWQSVYDATINSKDVRLDSLLFKKESDWQKDDRIGKAVVVNATLAYVAVGHRIEGYGTTWKISDGDFALYKQFWFELLPNLLPFLKTANLRVLKPGLESVDEALAINKNQSVSAQKVVFRG